MPPNATLHELPDDPPPCEQGAGGQTPSSCIGRCERAVFLGLKRPQNLPAPPFISIILRSAVAFLKGYFHE